MVIISADFTIGNIYLLAHTMVIYHMLLQYDDIQMIVWDRVCSDHDAGN